MSQFKFGDFTLHSGGKTNFLIDCNELTDQELQAIAAYVATKIPGFETVVGIPRGGLRFALALRSFATPGVGTVVIADDVYTTGSSMAEARLLAPNAMGAVLFARSEPPWWIFAMFRADHLA